SKARFTFATGLFRTPRFRGLALRFRQPAFFFPTLRFRLAPFLGLAAFFRAAAFFRLTACFLGAPPGSFLFLDNGCGQLFHQLAQLFFVARQIAGFAALLPEFLLDALQNGLPLSLSGLELLT